MSEYTFYLVPEDVLFVATPDQVRDCEKLWHRLSAKLERACVYNHPQLMLWNPLEIENVECPECGRHLSIAFDYTSFKAAEYGGWWKELVFLMQSDEGNGRSVMPCCGANLENQRIFSMCSPSPLFSLLACGAHEPDPTLFEPDHGKLKDAYLSEFEQLVGQKFAHLWLGD